MVLLLRFLMLFLSITLVSACGSHPAIEKTAQTPAMIAVCYETSRATLSQATQLAESHCQSFHKHAELTQEGRCGNRTWCPACYKQATFRCTP